ncbi:MAG: dTDP-glucose 4,6-dehydratase [Chloroflexota bacterium]|nr:dTDP-glucose 4,6-dehydratase [Chloroflexota bacterium]MBI5703134.1 dTDP-glucose 4,6-dehydratase [Chloroflexota bacterium]
MTNKQTVIVTGGCGFIGANFVRLLIQSGAYNVVNLDALTYAANPLSLADLEGHPQYTFVKGNITDRALVASLFEKYQPAGIFHLAAESHVDRSIVNAEDFVQTNVVGTYTLLEAARAYWNSLPQERKETFRFLHVSTDEVFGSLGPDGWFTEETPYAPNSPYSASKAASDHFVRAFHHTYGLPAIITNCSNNYGPYQFPEKMIPLMILNAISGKPLPVYGDGSNVRDWLYVEDHCKAVKLAFEKGTPGEVYVIGGNNEQKNINLVHKICDILDEVAPPAEVPQLHQQGLKSYRELIRFVTDRPGHDKRYAINPAKIRRELGWQPEVGFEAGLRRTIDWYLHHPEWVDQVSSGAYGEWIKKNYAWREAKEAK